MLPRLRNISLQLQTKLVAAFAVVIAMFLVAGMVVLGSQSRVRAAMTGLLDADVRAAKLSLEAYAAMLRARQNEKNYLLRYRRLGSSEASSRYISAVKARVADVRDLTGEIASLIDEPETIALAESIHDTVGLYERLLLGVVDSIGRREDEETGLLGELWARSRELEAAVGRCQSAQLSALVAILHRTETNYIFMGEGYEARRLREALGSVRTCLRDAPRVDLVVMADAYLVAFERVVKTDEEIDAGMEDLRTAAYRVEPLLEELRRRAARREAETRAGVVATIRTARWSLLGTCSAAVVLGLLVGASVSRRIGYSVRNSLAFARRLTQGDLTARLDYRGRDEFSMLADSLNHMADSLQASHVEIVRRSDELNELNATLEGKVRDRTHQTRAILDTAGDGIFGYDRDHRIQFANLGAQRLLGWTVAELQGMEVSSVLGDGAITASTSQLCEGKFRRKDGTSFTAEYVCAPIVEENIERSAVVSFRDVTALRELQAQLAQSQRLEAVGQLSAGIAHEINTPTQYIGDNVRFLQDAFRDIAALLDSLRALDLGDAGALMKIRELCARADFDFLSRECPLAIQQSLEGVDRVAKIVNSMKEFAHPGQAEKSEVDLNRVVLSATTVCRNEWKYVAELETELAADLPMVPCFAGDIGQLVVNLVVNSAHAIADVGANGSNGKGRITVRTRLTGEQVELQVSDTGAGIAEKHRAMIFEQFFTTKAVGKGTGQGLALARKLVVNRHGGTIRFESEEGKGTTFFVCLPLHPDDSRHEATPTHAGSRA